jgi:hypothetical protein
MNKLLKCNKKWFFKKGVYFWRWLFSLPILKSLFHLANLKISNTQNREKNIKALNNSLKIFFHIVSLESDRRTCFLCSCRKGQFLEYRIIFRSIFGLLEIIIQSFDIFFGILNVRDFEIRGFVGDPIFFLNQMIL